MSATEIDRQTLIRAHTAVVKPRSLPELSLHLVTPEQPWWWTSPEDLLPLGVVDPYWAFCWPGGTALGRYLLDYPQLVRGRRVLDLGAGSGVTALAAARAGATKVTVNDLDPWALSACELNAEINHLSLVPLLGDLIGAPLGDFDLVLLGDVSYSPELAARLWPWLQDLGAAGTEVLLADPSRGYLPATAKPSARVRVPAEIDAIGDHWVDVGIFSFS